MLVAPYGCHALNRVRAARDRGLLRCGEMSSRSSAKVIPDRAPFAPYRIAARATPIVLDETIGALIRTSKMRVIDHTAVDTNARLCFRRHMSKRAPSLYVWLTALWIWAWASLGCAPHYEIIASSSYLPTAAQVEAQIIRESIPPDLRKRLKKVIADSQARADNVGANRQYIGQAMPSPQMMMEKKLLETVLQWAAEKPPEERLVLQHRRTAFEAIVEESHAHDEPETSWIEDARVQRGAGVVAGAAIGAVPLGPYAADVAIELKVLPTGTYHARVGKACGEIVSGVIQMAFGCSGMTSGAAMTGTVSGAPAGVVVISASFALAANGYATAAHGIHEAQQLWREEAPPNDVAPQAPQAQLLKPKTQPKPKTQSTPPAQAVPAKPAPQAKAAQPAKVVKPETTTPKTAQGKPNGAKKPSNPSTSPAGKPSGSDAVKPVAKPRGGDTPAAARGRQVHEEFKQKVKAKKEKDPRWDEKPSIIEEGTNKEYRPDALTRNGHPLELKPNTPSGRAAGERQIKKYEAVTKKKGRVLYYDP